MRINNRDVLILVLTACVAVASASDILNDLGHGASKMHLLQESTIMLLALALMLRMVFEIRRKKRELQLLRQQMKEASVAAQQRNPALLVMREKLRLAVESQFKDWGLTQSESEVGWLLLKGLSIKEVASLRETQEKTVRQQASAIYRKADLPGRHAFAAWFLEDLL